MIYYYIVQFYLGVALSVLYDTDNNIVFGLNSVFVNDGCSTVNEAIHLYIILYSTVAYSVQRTDGADGAD